jgi:hypothetical protein
LKNFDKERLQAVMLSFAERRIQAIYENSQIFLCTHNTGSAGTGRHTGPDQQGGSAYQ